MYIQLVCRISHTTMASSSSTPVPIDIPKNPPLKEIKRVGRYRLLQKNASGTQTCPNTEDLISYTDFDSLKDGSLIIQRMKKDSTQGFNCYDQSTLQSWLTGGTNTDPETRDKLTTAERKLIFLNLHSTHTLEDHTNIQSTITEIKLELHKWQSRRSVSLLFTHPERVIIIGVNIDGEWHRAEKIVGARDTSVVRWNIDDFPVPDFDPVLYLIFEIFGRPNETLHITLPNTNPTYYLESRVIYP